MKEKEKRLVGSRDNVSKKVTCRPGQHGGQVQSMHHQEVIRSCHDITEILNNNNSLLSVILDCRILIFLCCTLFDREIDLKYSSNLKYSSKTTVHVNIRILIILCCTLCD